MGELGGRLFKIIAVTSSGLGMVAGIISAMGVVISTGVVVVGVGFGMPVRFAKWKNGMAATGVVLFCVGIFLPAGELPILVLPDSKGGGLLLWSG